MHRARELITGTLLVVAFSGCGSTGAPPRHPDAAVRASQTTVVSDVASVAPDRSLLSRPGPGRRTVVIISIDGLNPDAITMLGERLRAMSRLIREGTSTLNARSLVESTETLPNHTGMLTGRSVMGGRGSGVTFNEDNGSVLAQVHGSYVPSLFDIAHDHGLTTAFFAQKDKFAFLRRSWDGGHGALDVTGHDGGRDKLDLAEIRQEGSQAAEVARAIVHDHADLLFWHLRAPDAAGHDHGCMGPEYLHAVERADADIATLLRSLAANRAALRRTTVIVVADHGGTPGERSHADASASADYRIPFVVWGRDVRPATDLYALNPSRKDPGLSQPAYDGAQPIRNADVARLALRLLGLPALEGASGSTLAPLSVR